MTCGPGHVLDRLEEERAQLAQAVELIDWRFSQRSVIEARIAVIDWVIGMLNEECA